jgi:hypothetical protein
LILDIAYWLFDIQYSIFNIQYFLIFSDTHSILIAFTGFVSDALMAL